MVEERILGQKACCSADLSSSKYKESLEMFESIIYHVAIKTIERKIPKPTADSIKHAGDDFIDGIDRYNQAWKFRGNTMEKLSSKIVRFIFSVGIFWAPIIFVFHLVNKDWTNAHRPLVTLVALGVSLFVASLVHFYLSRSTTGRRWSRALGRHRAS